VSSAPRSETGRRLVEAAPAFAPGDAPDEFGAVHERSTS